MEAVLRRCGFVLALIAAAIFATSGVVFAANPHGTPPGQAKNEGTGGNPHGTPPGQAKKDEGTGGNPHGTPPGQAPAGPQGPQGVGQGQGLSKPNPPRICKRERADADFFHAQHPDAGDKTFAEYYGTNANRRNAFGKCVSRNAKAKHGATGPTGPTGATGATGADGPGKGHGRGHGRGLSQDDPPAGPAGPTGATGQDKKQAKGQAKGKGHAKGKGKGKRGPQGHGQGLSKPNPARICKRERADADFFHAQHPDAGDKTFAEYYGTNANRRNAFGKCVSRHAKAKHGATGPTGPTGPTGATGATGPTDTDATETAAKHGDDSGNEGHPSGPNGPNGLGALVSSLMGPQ